MKTVFFGPFIGEFGWEYSYWHAWVNKVCKEDFKDYRKIVSSYPGRESFYPYADEYLPHSKEYMDYFISCNGYITDYWKDGFPRPNTSITKKFVGLIPYESWIFISKPENQVCVHNIANKLLEECKKNLPQDTIFFTPFNICEYKSMKFGVEVNAEVTSDIDINQIPIPFSKQDFEILEPTIKAKEIVSDYLKENDKLIAIFPRNRAQRRVDKNWSKDKYLELIAYYKLHFPEYKIGIFGAPDQAFFDDGVPSNTLDFINLEESQRMNIQIAALKHADLAVGSLSGAMLVARASGVPTLSWSLKRDHDRFHGENRSNVETILHTVQDPPTEDIAKLSYGILTKEIKYDSEYVNWNSIEYLKSGDGNNKSIARRIGDFFHDMLYVKNKDYE